MIDIANREKHGYPSNGRDRSRLDPYLGEVGRHLELRTGPQPNSCAVFTFSPKTGKTAMTTSGSAEGSVVFWGRVLDRNSAVIGDILDPARGALDDWQRLFSSLNIALP